MSNEIDVNEIDANKKEYKESIVYYT